MNQTYFEWYEFDVNVVPVTHCNLYLIKTRCCGYECESEYKVKF